jgi:hypothetical protein
MNRIQREQTIVQMLAIIRSDFNRMLHLVDPGMANGGLAAAQRTYLVRQVGKYLKPLNRVDFCQNVTALLKAFQHPPLLNSADDQGAVLRTKPNWDTEGDGPEHVSIKLRAGGGWAWLGKDGGRKIRINQKSFVLFPRLTLRGIMVHEATHFVLDTEDIHYSTFTRNSVMQALENGSENADNWRIFYQKMSSHFATGEVE